jgi:hypothetical protein
MPRRLCFMRSLQAGRDRWILIRFVGGCVFEKKQTTRTLETEIRSLSRLRRRMLKVDRSGTPPCTMRDRLRGTRAPAGEGSTYQISRRSEHNVGAARCRKSSPIQPRVPSSSWRDANQSDVLILPLLAHLSSRKAASVRVWLEKSRRRRGLVVKLDRVARESLATFSS